MTIKTMFKKVRSVDEIIASFDSTLKELQDRVSHDDAQIAQILEDRRAAELAHEQKMKELEARQNEHASSSSRATRIAEKIRSLVE